MRKEKCTNTSRDQRKVKGNIDSMSSDVPKLREHREN